MLELKGEIKREEDKHVGFNHWVKLHIGSAVFKMGEVMIRPHFPGLQDYENRIKKEISNQIDSLKQNELTPRMRRLVEIHRADPKDNAESKKIHQEIDIIKKKISLLQHSLHTHHEIEGKKFRLIIYDG